MIKYQRGFQAHYFKRNENNKLNNKDQKTYIYITVNKTKHKNLIAEQHAP